MNVKTNKNKMSFLVMMEPQIRADIYNIKKFQK